MSLEGKVEKRIEQFLYCAGISGNVVKGTCERCEFYGGIRKEPVKQIDKDGTEKTIKINEYILCKYPKLEKIHDLYRVGD